MHTQKTEYVFSAQAIDEASQQTQLFLEQTAADKKSVLRLRLTVETLLLKWQLRFGEDAAFTLRTGSRFGRPYLLLETAGEAFDPTAQADRAGSEDFGEFGERVLANLGLTPTYSYKSGKNQLLFKLQKRKRNPFIGLCIAVSAALLFGFGGLAVLPDALRAGAVESVLTPLYNTFLGVLSAIAGPMIFLSVAWGIYGIGDAATLGRIGKKMILRFLGVTVLITAVSTALFLPFFDLHFSSATAVGSQLGGIFDMILGVFPENIVSPFADGNMMQIILIAAVVGSIMLILGSQTRAVAELIEQVNYIIQFLMELVGSLVPAFIFLVLLRLIWSDSLGTVSTGWKPILLFLLAATVILTGVLGYIAVKKRVSPLVLLRKCFPTFLIALTTASSSAAFGTNVACCEKQLGISGRLTNFGIPLGIVLYAPATAINFLVCALYMAENYRTEVSAAWLLTAVLIVSILTVASPPVPGGALACYTIIFSQLGLPDTALEVVLVLDVLFDFLATGFNMTFLQSELLLQANKMQLLDDKILRKRG